MATQKKGGFKSQIKSFRVSVQINLTEKHTVSTVLGDKIL